MLQYNIIRVAFLICAVTHFEFMLCICTESINSMIVVYILASFGIKTSHCMMKKFVQAILVYSDRP